MKKNLFLFPIIALAIILVVYYLPKQQNQTEKSFENKSVVLVSTEQIPSWKTLSPIIAWHKNEPQVALRFDAENIPMHMIYVYDLKAKTIVRWGLKTDDAKDLTWQDFIGKNIDEAITIDEANARLNQMDLTNISNNRVGSNYTYNGTTYVVQAPNKFHTNSVRFYLPGVPKKAVTLYLAKKDKDFDGLNTGETVVYESPSKDYLLAIARDLHPEFGLRQMVWFDTTARIFSQKPFLAK